MAIGSLGVVVVVCAWLAVMYSLFYLSWWYSMVRCDSLLHL